jgi:hypothetical protein
MSQFGMQMPGAGMQRRASMNVYTGLLGLAAVCLIAAVVLVGLAATTIGPDGSPLDVHAYNDASKSYDVSKLTKQP